MHAITQRYDSPLGPVLLEADGLGLTGLRFDAEAKTAPAGNGDAASAVLAHAVEWLDAYFAGQRPQSVVPLHLGGSPFSLAVWERLQSIPYGEVVTYGALATEMAALFGRARMAAQAVGGAVGRNPVAILVPCHRVVGSNGNLTGYAGGMDKKVALLAHEGLDMDAFHLPKPKP